MSSYKCPGSGVAIAIEGLERSQYGHKIFCTRCGHVSETN